MISAIYAILFWAATADSGRRRGGENPQICAHTPAPLKIPTTPAPTTTGGVVLRMFREVVFFESLFKSNKWIWLFGWTLSYGDVARPDPPYPVFHA